MISTNATADFVEFNKTELELFNLLVKLGDTKEIALFTVISEKYENKKAIQIQD